MEQKTEQQTHSGLFPLIFSYKKKICSVTYIACNKCTKIAADLNPKTTDVVRSETRLHVIQQLKTKADEIYSKESKENQ